MLRFRGLCLLLLALVAMLAGSASAASAATLTVTQTSDTPPGTGACTAAGCSLRQAVEAAADGDTIVLPASSTPYGLVNGQLTLTKGVTVKGAGAGASVVQAQDADRIMLINGNLAPVRIEGVTLTGGNTTRSGGGALAAGGPGALILTRVIVSGNHVNPSAAGSDQGGGGVFSIPSLTLNHTTITGNSVTVTQSTGDSGGGGVLVRTGDLNVNDSTVSGNTATISPVPNEGIDNNGGGGIYQDGATLTIARSVVRGNTAAVSTAKPNVATPADGGGGIYQFGTNFRLVDSTVADNVAHGPGVAKGGGGGIFDDGDTSQYLNSTVVGNSTDVLPATAIANSDGGGGILFDMVQGGVEMANMTISGNAATGAVGGGLNTALAPTFLSVTDSIIARNTDSAHSGAGGNCAGPVSSSGYNLTDDSAATNSCSLTGPGDQLSAAPGLGALADNGGPTPTEALLAGSPAIDAGDPSGCTDLLTNSVVADQRGVARPQPAGGRCDIGAYERALPTVVTGGATVSGSAVTLAGMAGNPDAGPASMNFQYGSTTAYGAATAAQPLAAEAPTSAFGASVTGLAPGRYHFRAVVTNAAGTVAGADGLFTVASPAPKPNVAPIVTKVAESRSRWRLGHHLARLARASRPPVGTTFGFTLNEPARVSLVFRQMLPGVLVAGQCAAPNHANRRHHRCTRLLAQGSLSGTAHAGRNRVSFEGRLSATRTLAPGSYTMTLSATAGGKVAFARPLVFTIVR